MNRGQHAAHDDNGHGHTGHRGAHDTGHARDTERAHDASHAHDYRPAGVAC